MTFFVTGAGPGKGADLGGIEGADQHCQTVGAAPRRGRKNLARLSQHPGGRRQAGGQRPRPHRQRPVAELQGHGGRDQPRRSAQRQQQAQLRQLADRARPDHSRRRLRAEPPRRADRLDAGRPGVPGRRGSHLPQLDEQHPGRGHGRPYRPQGLARRCAVAVMEFVASLARARWRLQPEPICAAPAATGCSIASPPSKGLCKLAIGGRAGRLGPRSLRRPAAQVAISFLVSKFSSISTLLGSRRKICQRVLLGTWFTRCVMPLPVRCFFMSSKPRLPNAT